MATFTTGDTAKPLTGTAKNGDAAADLTGATAVVHLRKPDGTTLTGTATITAPTTGAWSYQWQTGDLDTPGGWKVELQVTYSSGAIQTFGPEGFYVNAQIA